MRKHFYIQNSITLKMLLLYHPKADSIKDVYAALMRRQMQWSHLISDKWAPRFHSLWSRSSFLVSTFLFLSKKPCVWSLFSPSNLSWGSKNTTLSRNYLWEKLLTTCGPQCCPNLSEFTFLFLCQYNFERYFVIMIPYFRE